MKTTPLLIALIATASFAGGAIANEDCGHAGGMHMQGMHGDGEKMAAFHAKHLARLHGKLKLTAQQEPAWKAFTEKSKPDLAKSKAVREEMATLTTPARASGLAGIGTSYLSLFGSGKVFVVVLRGHFRPPIGRADKQVVTPNDRTGVALAFQGTFPEHVFIAPSTPGQRKILGLGVAKAGRAAKLRPLGRVKAQGGAKANETETRSKNSHKRAKHESNLNRNLPTWEDRSCTQDLRKKL